MKMLELIKTTTKLIHKLRELMGDLWLLVTPGTLVIILVVIRLPILFRKSDDEDEQFNKNSISEDANDWLNNQLKDENPEIEEQSSLQQNKEASSGDAITLLVAILLIIIWTIIQSIVNLFS